MMLIEKRRSNHRAFNVRYGSFSASHIREVCWSNPMQMTGQAEGKWVGKSVQLPRLIANSGDKGSTHWSAPINTLP